MSGELTIKISNNSPDILMSIQEVDGSVIKKIVSAEDLTTSFINSYQFSTGILPRGTRFFKGTKESFHMGIEVASMLKPSIIVDPSDNKKREINLPLPPCLFACKIDRGVIRHTSMHALKRSILSEEDQLYNFPYGNTYVGSGQICWGRVVLPKIRSPLEAARLVGTFLDSGYNGDLWEPSTNINCSKLKVSRNFQSFVEYMKDKKDFPMDALIKDVQFREVIG